MASGQTQVHLHLHGNREYPITLHNGIKDCSYNVRISARHQQPSERDQTQVTLKVLREYKCLEFKGEDNNEMFQETDFFAYSTSTTDLSNLGFVIDVFSKVPGDSTLTHQGQGHTVPLQLTGSNGTLIISLINKSLQAIGTISLDYLLVKPWFHPCNIPSQQSRRSRGISGYKKEGSYLCGHRGVGETFGTTMKLTRYPENTIIAFKAAHEVGMDFVEMDVQVSKDNVPVVFHDGTVKLCLETSVPEKSISFEVPVKDLTAEQMKRAKVWEWSTAIENQKIKNSCLKRKIEDNTTSSSTSAPDNTLDYTLFPTLEEILREVPQETGFLLELKYPFQEKCGDSIDDLCIDKNLFMDSILQVVFEKAGERKILFGSFDPDICTMCQSKQSKYPVLLITQGNTTIWEPYLDIRSRSAAMAVAVAKSQNLDGIHIFSSVLFDASEKIEKILKEDLTLTVWGHENDEPKKKSWLIEHGIHCVQIDDIFGSARDKTTSN